MTSWNAHKYLRSKYLQVSSCVFYNCGSDGVGRHFSGGDALRGHTRSHPEHDG